MILGIHLVELIEKLIRLSHVKLAEPSWKQELGFSRLSKSTLTKHLRFGSNEARHLDIVKRGERQTL
jgi:hypothetical protein